MDKQQIYAYLNENNIWYEAMEHAAVYNMQQVAQLTLPHPKAEAKNLFVRDDKKRNYYMLTVCGDKRVDLKSFRKAHNTRPLTFASSQDLEELLQLTPGAVTPLGLLNDASHRVQLFLDADFLSDEGLIGVHPNDNTASIWLKTTDLIAILRAHASCVQVVQF